MTPNEQACSDVDPEMFFGPADSAAGGPLFEWERRALEVCGGCPGVAPCLDEALKHPGSTQHGVVGGLTAAQRRAELVARRAGVAVAAARAGVAVRQVRAGKSGRSWPTVADEVGFGQDADAAGVAR